MLASLPALRLLPLWAFPATPFWLAVGAFLMQMCAPGRLGRHPGASPRAFAPQIRATFPGFVYQLGNFLASYNATLQATAGERPTIGIFAPAPLSP